MVHTQIIALAHPLTDLFLGKDDTSLACLTMGGG
jgi:hypothetical protein